VCSESSCLTRLADDLLPCDPFVLLLSASGRLLELLGCEPEGTAGNGARTTGMMSWAWRMSFGRYLNSRIVRGPESIFTVETN